MKHKAQQGQLLLSITFAVLGIVVPYLIAWRISPAGTVFTGFLLNPVDGFSYLAKMRQGYDGAWLFQLSYAADPGSGTLLFVFYILLGHISRVLGMPLILTYHLARIMFSIFMFILIYVFFSTVFEEVRVKWAAFLLSIFGSGLGWLALPVFGQQSIDLWVPEAIPFLTAYTNPHFPLAAIAFLGGMLLVYKRVEATWWHRMLTVACGFTLGAVLPFIIVPLILVLIVWILWEAILQRGEEITSWFQGRPLALILIVVGALPWLMYDFWLSFSHPVISQWNSQNLTPSPPIFDTILGFGLVFLLALFSLYNKPWSKSSSGRLFTIWFLLGFVLLYLPLPFQRRLNLGLFIPMAGLSAWWLNERFRAQRRFLLVQASLLLTSLPSLLLVITVGVSGVARGEQAIIFSRSELETYAWIEENVTPGTLFLADPLYGNRLPAFSAVRVLYGHPFETPQADKWMQEVNMLLNWDGPPEAAQEKLSRLAVDKVLYQTETSDSQAPTWLSTLDIEASFGDFFILENISR